MDSIGSATRLVLLASLVAGLSYFWVVVTGLEGPGAIAWKGAGVALLALWCALNAKTLDGWLLTLVMFLGAAGDMLLEIDQTMGGAAFLAGHLVATGLFLRNRRPQTSLSQKGLAIVLVPAVPLIARAMPADPAQANQLMLYALPLALMAATAWTSRFPRYRVGLGAMLFVVSDLLIFARFGPLSGASWPSLVIWPAYFTGQVMIATGVVRTLAADRN